MGNTSSSAPTHMHGDATCTKKHGRRRTHKHGHSKHGHSKHGHTHKRGHSYKRRHSRRHRGGSVVITPGE